MTASVLRRKFTNKIVKSLLKKEKEIENSWQKKTITTRADKKLSTTHINSSYPFTI